MADFIADIQHGCLNHATHGFQNVVESPVDPLVFSGPGGVKVVF